jgi:hypothetical protein
MNEKESELLERIKVAGLSELLEYKRSALITKTGIMLIGVALWLTILSTLSIFSIVVCVPLLFMLSLMQVEASNVLTEIKKNLKKFEGVDR